MCFNYLENIFYYCELSIYFIRYKLFVNDFRLQWEIEIDGLQFTFTFFFFFFFFWKNAFYKLRMNIFLYKVKGTDIII